MSSQLNLFQEQYPAPPDLSECRFTPRNYAEAVREVLGEIDCDPASCDEANLIIQAKRYYTIETDGLSQSADWSGRVYLNPPFDNKSPWIMRLLSEYHGEVTTAAILLVNVHHTSKWFYPLYAHYRCFPYKRMEFPKPGGEVDNRNFYEQVITYFGPDVERFKRVFVQFGPIESPAYLG